MEFARFIFERSSEEGSEPDFATSGPSVAMTPAVFWPDSISERCDRLSLSVRPFCFLANRRTQKPLQVSFVRFSTQALTPAP